MNDATWVIEADGEAIYDAWTREIAEEIATGWRTYYPNAEVTVRRRDKKSK